MLDRGYRPTWKENQPDTGPWQNGLTGAGPQAEYSMGSWGWRTDPSIGPHTGDRIKHFTREGFNGYFNSAYGDDVEATESGIYKAALLCMIPYLLFSGSAASGLPSIRNLTLGVALLFWMLTPAMPFLLRLIST